MSRSYKKTPIGGNTCASSEKQDKRKNNRKLRNQTKRAIKREDETLPKMKDVSDPWLMAKDGKTWWDNPENYKK